MVDVKVMLERRRIRDLTRRILTMLLGKEKVQKLGLEKACQEALRLLEKQH